MTETVPTIFIIDDDDAVRAVVRVGLKISPSTPWNSSAQRRRSRRWTSKATRLFILLDLALAQSDALDMVRGLGDRKYVGKVCLMSGARRGVLDAVERLGVRAGLSFVPALVKPFKLTDIAAIGQQAIAAAPVAP